MTKRNRRKKRKSRKKPIYKQVFFWLFIVSLLIIALLTNITSNLLKEVNKLNQELTIARVNPVNISGNNEVEESLESSSTEIIEQKIYTVNDEAKIYDKAGKETYSIKIIEVTTNLNEEDKNLTEDNPNPFKVTYEYKNYALDKPLKISGQFINAYINGIASNDMPYMINQTDVSQGKSARASIFFYSNEPLTDVSEVEVEYINDFSLKFEDSILFKVPLNK